MDWNEMYEKLTEGQKKIFSDYDERIRRVLDKPPEYFFKARKEGGEIYDSDILGLLKMIDYDRMVDDPTNHRRLLTSLSNKICQLYEQWLDAETKLSEK